MEVIGILSGGAPVIKKYQVSATIATVGTPLLAVAAAEAGLNISSTTAINDMVGINYDTATFVTAQQAAFDAERTVAVCINPDAIIDIPMSGGAAAGTAEDTATVTTASTTGLTVTTAATDFNTVDQDEGTIWCITGANAGQVRKITSTATTSATVTVAFDRDIAVGDTFGYAPVSVMTLDTVTLCTELTEFRQNIANAANTAEFTCIELNPNNWLNSSSSPYGLFIANDHILKREA